MDTFPDPVAYPYSYNDRTWKRMYILKSREKMYTATIITPSPADDRLMPDKASCPIAIPTIRAQKVAFQPHTFRLNSLGNDIAVSDHLNDQCYLDVVERGDLARSTERCAELGKVQPDL